MNIAVTKGIKVTVSTSYESAYSDPTKNMYLFSYHIRIENIGDEIVQLMKRHWFITDSNGMRREVLGEGVVGRQPVFYPEDFHEYDSACDLQTEMGTMHGTYLMRELKTNKYFTVNIPMFHMIAPQKMN